MSTTPETVITGTGPRSGKNVDKVPGVTHYLSKLRQPTLIANGDNDRMVPSVPSNELHDRIDGSHLIIYPNSGHGGIFQYVEKFAPVATTFLAA